MLIETRMAHEGRLNLISHALVVIAAMFICNEALAAEAAAYPARPVRLVVPFSPGGGSDTTARIVAQKLAAAWGQQVIVDNRPGGNGNIGADVVAKSAPDGYMLFLANANHTINPGLFKKLTYDAIKDFAPVTLVANQTNVLVVHPSLPVRNVKELIAVAKARPGQLNFASAGTGTPSHLGGELFRSMARIEMVHIPYKGAAPVLVDLMAGQVSIAIAGLSTALPHIQSGRLKALGVTTSKRSSAMPNLPTISEAGVPGFEVTNWYGVLTRAGTPTAIVGKLNEELTRVIMMPDVREKFVAQGMEPATNSPEQFGRFIEADVAKWAKVIRDFNIQPD